MRDGLKICIACMDRKYIHSYSHKPTPQFYGHGDDHMGIELEVECPADSKRWKIIDQIQQPWFYCKSDASISHGFELVTHPMTYKYIRNSRKEISYMLSTLRKSSCLAYDTHNCGIHIHISKAAMKPIHIVKFMNLIYENPLFTLAISNREKEKMDQYASLSGDIKKNIKNMLTQSYALFFVF